MGFKNEKDASSRDAKVGCIFGKKGKGKSTFIKEHIIEPWYNARLKLFQDGKTSIPPRVLIYDPTFASAFQGYSPISVEELREGKQVGNKLLFVKQGIHRVSNDDPFDLLAWIVSSNGLRNSLLIMDEAQDVGKPVGIPPQLLRELYSRHRNYSLDVYFVYHSPLELHVRLRNKINFYVWFDIGMNINSVKWFESKLFPEPKAQYKAYKATYKKHIPSQIIQPFEVVVIPD